MSVARQCNILDKNKTVWLGELIENEGTKTIKWNNVSDESENL
jgi:hypothetical protein